MGTTSYLPGCGTSEAAQNKAAKALTNEWATMAIVRHCADPDDPPDAVESDGYLDAANSVPASVPADDSSHTEKPEERVRAAFGRNTPRSTDIETSFQPVLDPIEAKYYARSAAPTHRGSRERMCTSILDIGGRVFV